MTPPTFLLALLAITACAVAVSALCRARIARRVRALGRELRMHYVHKDRFNLAARLNVAFPVAGAAHLHVRDVLYALRGERYHWLFTVVFTEGVIRRQRRICRAAMFCEPRDIKAGECSPIRLADPSLSLLDQYRRLHETAMPQPMTQSA